MLRMVDVEFIKLRARDGWSIREISRRSGWSRQAVRKALAAPAAPPRYELSAPRPSPVMGPYLPLVRQWLADDETAPPKQRHTARRIYDRLPLILESLLWHIAQNLCKVEIDRR